MTLPDLFETKGSGLFDLLDEEARLPRPSTQHFTAAAHLQYRGHFRLDLPRKSRYQQINQYEQPIKFLYRLREHRELKDDEGFLVRHFAGTVLYHTAAFLAKNNDALHASLEFLLADCRYKHSTINQPEQLQKWSAQEIVRTN
jgi:myosin-6